MPRSGSYVLPGYFHAVTFECSVYFIDIYLYIMISYWNFSPMFLFWRNACSGDSAFDLFDLFLLVFAAIIPLGEFQWTTCLKNVRQMKGKKVLE